MAMENEGALVAWSGLTSDEERVRIALLQMYADGGRAPALENLATRVGLSVSRLHAILGSLEARDMIVLDNDGDRIIGAYPFTEAETEHRVELGRQTLHAMCAIDALGMGAMFDSDIRIQSSCRMCGISIDVTSSNRGRALARWAPEAAIVWSGIRYEQRCAANSLCQVLAFFCGDEHLEAWRQRQGNDSHGFRLSMEEGLELGRSIFENTLKPGLARETSHD
jgi:hypothetical protein